MVALMASLSNFKFINDKFGHDNGAALETLRARLERPWNNEGHALTLTAAMGVVSYPVIAHTPDDVVAALEYAEIEAQRLGRAAPFVCTPAVIDAIHRRGCTLMQGYLFARPMPPVEAASRIVGSEAETMAQRKGA